MGFLLLSPSFCFVSVFLILFLSAEISVLFSLLLFLII